jgi:sterol 14-demethylase
MAWALVLLLQHPAYLDSVVDELPDGRSNRLDWALKEAVRLRPVMSHYARTNAVDYERGGYRMPRGWLTMLCPTVAHRLPEVFADPEAYDPERFGPGREEDRRPFAMIGFSGGFYRCPGSGFGMAEMRIVLARLLSRYALDLAGGGPPAAFDLGVNRPASPCRVHYARR